MGWGKHNMVVRWLESRDSVVTYCLDGRVQVLYGCESTVKG